MKLISCNVEGDRHFKERLFPLFAKEKADVLALQEVFEADLERIKKVSGLDQYLFYPQANITKPNIHLPLKGEWGVAIFANDIIQKDGFYYFRNHDDRLVVFQNDNSNSIDRVALRAKVKVDDHLFQIINIHFTWSGRGQITDEQRISYQILESYLSKHGQCILCGDLNSPREGEIFDHLATIYHDNIPTQVKTTIDKNLHKSGKDIQLVVDCLFTSPDYQVEDIRVVPNTSDHMAVVAEIKKVDR